jgi:hypothetical protein
MAFLKRGTAIGEIEKERDQLLTRRKALLAQQAAATAALARAIEDRSQRMVEADMDAGTADKARALTIRLRDENDSITDALASLDAKIGECEARLEIERERGKRDQERQARQEQLDHVRDVRERFREACRELIAALKPLASIGPDSANAHAVTEYLDAQLALAHEAGFAECASYVARVSAGATEIKVEPPAASPTPPPATIERKAVFLRHPGRWTEENGEVITAGRHVVCSPPIAVALAAIQHGHAVDPESRVAQELRRLQDPDFAWQPPASCIDISRPIPAPQLAEAHATTPLVHSGLPGQPRVGVNVPNLR